MTISRRLADLRGGVRLAVDGVKGVTRIVEGVHGSVVRIAPPIGNHEQRPLRGITGLVYRSIHGTTGLVGRALDVALTGVERLVTTAAPGTNRVAPGDAAERDAIVSALNGVVGDHFQRTGNPLAIDMQVLRRGGDGPLPLLLVHGLCMNDRQWSRGGHDHGKALATSLGYSPIYLRYNTGLHIADNGAALAALLETTLASWPVPVERLTIIGHSMGGLVARHAAHHALAAGMAWPHRLKRLVSLGTPYHGAALERGGNWLHRGLGVSPYLAPFTRLSGLRSAGITDLRHGAVLPLPPAIASYSVAGALGQATRGDWRGDGLVSVDSALGHGAKPSQRLGIAPSHTFVANGVGHLDLLASSAVYAKLHKWLA
ncbi:MAG: alpha/beta fold hydrolase [Pseudomonadota bacterium]